MKVDIKLLDPEGTEDCGDNEFHAAYEKGETRSFGLFIDDKAFLLQDYDGVTGGDIRKLMAMMREAFGTC
jgi:hypothetical protein